MRSLTEIWVKNALSIQTSVFEIMTKNVLVVSKSVAEDFNPHVVADSGLRFFRHTDEGDHLFLMHSPDRLDSKDNEAIATRCDGVEKAANKRVKSILAKAIQAGVGNDPTHIFDVGCGAHPIINEIPRTKKLAFTGIDCLDHRMNISSSSDVTVTNFDSRPVPFEDVVAEPIVEHDHIPVVTAVYSLHFFDKRKFPDQLMNIIDFGGFFAGNLHLVGGAKEREQQLEEMKTALDMSGMAYKCIEDGSHNSFFVIADEENEEVVQKVAGEVKRQVQNYPLYRR